MAYLITNKEKILFSKITEPVASPSKVYNLVTAIISSWNNDTPYFYLKTSGTTGPSKSIKFKKEQITYSANQTIKTFNLQQGDKLYLCLSPEHSAGFMMIMRALILDTDLIFTEPKANPFISLPDDIRLDFASFVPYQLLSILEENPEKLPLLNNMKAILLGGNKTSSSAVTELKNISAPLYETFGMTETLTHFAIRRLNGRKPQKYFIPLEGVTISVNEAGCLLVKSPVTLNRQITTVDLINLNPDGSFKWIGRTDKVINSAGFKIHLEVIEDKITQITTKICGKTSFFLFSVPDKKLGSRLEMVVETDFTSAQNPDILMKELRSSLEPLELPKQIHYVSKFSYTSLGKINRIKTLKQLRLS